METPAGRELNLDKFLNRVLSTIRRSSSARSLDQVVPVVLCLSSFLLSGCGVAIRALALPLTAMTLAPAASQIAITGGALSMNVGGCSSAFVLSTLDASLSPVNNSADLPISLNASGAQAFYSDAACTLSISSATIPAGSASTSVYMKDPVSETVLWVASPTSLAPVSSMVSFTSLTPSVLSISGPGSFSAATCSQAFTLYSMDSSGNYANVTAPTTVSLTSGGSPLFYSDPNCAFPATTFVIPNGKASANFYVKDPVSESFLLQAAAAGLSSATLPLTILAMAPAKLALTGSLTPPTTNVANTCSGTYTLTTYDTLGNLAPPPAAMTLTLAGKGAGTFYSNSTCTSVITTVTLPAGTPSTVFYFKDATAESLLFSASSTGVAAASLALATQGGTATKLVLTGSLAGVTNGCAGPFTVTAKDANNNTVSVASLQANLTQTGAAVFYPTVACAGAITSVTLTSASSQTFYAKDATAQTINFTATDNAAVLTASTLSSVIFSATGLVLSGPAAPALATCTGPYTVTNKNGAGAATNVAGATTVTLTGNGSGTFYTAVGCGTSTTTVSIGAGTSSQTFYFQDAAAENLTFSASAAAIAKGTYAITTGTPAPNTLALSGAASVTTGACTPYTFTAKNLNGTTSNVTALTPLTLAGNGSGAFYTDVGCSAPATSPQLAANTSSITYYLKDFLTETLTLQAYATGLAAGSLAVTVNAAAPTMLALSGPDQVPLGQCSTAFTVKSLDPYRNRSNVSMPLTINLAGKGAGTFYSDSGCSAPVSSVTLANASSSIPFYFRDATSETLAFTATDSTSTLGSTSSSLVTITAPSSITVGSHSTCAIISGKVWCWGSYQLGAQFVASPTPQQIPWFANSTVTALANGSRGYLSFSCVIINGGVQCWGNGYASNSSGQLGNGSTNWPLTPNTVTGLTSGVTAISAGNGQQACAIQNGAAWCWGNNASGQLGNNSTASYSTVPLAVSGLSSGVTSIAVGSDYACAVVSGSVMCWGSNTYGQLGDGTTTLRYSPVSVNGIAGTVTQVDVGDNHSCAITSVGALYCWGANGSYQIGDGTNVNRLSAVLIIASGVTAVSGGANHTCAIVSGGLQCWGANSNGSPDGQVGNNSVATQPVPIGVTGLSSGVTCVSAAALTTCAIANGSVFCWGNSAAGQGGLPYIVQTATPVQISTLTSGVSQVSIGSSTACAVVNGGAQCWGNNSTNLGIGSTITNPLNPVPIPSLASGVTQIVAGYVSVCALANGGVQCWGSGNSSGQLGNNVSALSAPRESAILSDRTVRSQG
jgi:alpha-tubulin suppressor-like RCC1 family protein